MATQFTYASQGRMKVLFIFSYLPLIRQRELLEEAGFQRAIDHKQSLIFLWKITPREISEKQ